MGIPTKFLRFLCLSPLKKSTPMQILERIGRDIQREMPKSAYVHTPNTQGDVVGHAAQSQLVQGPGQAHQGGGGRMGEESGTIYCKLKSGGDFSGFLSAVRRNLSTPASSASSRKTPGAAATPTSTRPPCWRPTVASTSASPRRRSGWSRRCGWWRRRRRRWP